MSDISVEITGSDAITAVLTSGIDDAPNDGNYYARHNQAWAALGSMALQSAAAIAITGGTIDNTPIGSTTPAAIKATTVLASGRVTTAASASGGAGLTLPQGTAPSAPGNGDMWMTSAGLYYQAGGVTTGPLSATTGTVTSVGLSMPGQFTVSNSPVTGAGTLTAVWNNQLTNTFLAGPSGSTGAPTFRTIVSADINTALLTPGPIGTTTAAAGAFTTLGASGVISSTVTTGTAPFSVSSTTVVPNLYVARAALADTATVGGNLTGPITSVGNATAIAAQTGTGSTFVVQTSPTLITPNIGVATGTSLDGAAIGAITPSTGAFTTLSARGVITSTVTTGTAPFTVASTTVVGNLNVSQLLGGTWAVPGAIGSTTPGTGAFTTLMATSASAVQLTVTSTAGNAQAAFVPNSGTAYNIGSNGTNVFIYNGTATVCTIGGISSTNSTITLTAATGHNPVFVYAINGVSEFETYAGAGGNYFCGDIVNGTTPLSYTAGAIGVGFWTFANTLNATSGTSASVVMNGGLGIAGAIYCNGGGTLTASTAGFTLNQTWNNSGVSFTAVLIDITNTASTTVSSYPFQIIVSGTSMFSVNGFGTVQFNGNLNGPSNLFQVIGSTGATTTGILSAGAASNPSANTFGGNKIWGRNNAAADTAGAVGETISSIITSSVSLAATGTPGNVTSLALTAGKWKITLWGVLNGGTTGFTASTNLFMSINSTSATNGTQGSTMTQKTVANLISGGAYDLGLMIVVNISASTTYYAVVQAAYAAGSPTFNGTMVAVRLP